MYSLLRNVIATPGNRDLLASLMHKSRSQMDGCIAFHMAGDTANPDMLWFWESWESKAELDAFLADPEVMALVSRGREVISGSDARFELVPLWSYQNAETKAFIPCDV